MRINPIALGNSIRRLRKERTLTQAALAENCNVSVQFIGQLERGKKSPSFDLFLTLCLALHVTPQSVLMECLPEEELRSMQLLPGSMKLNDMPLFVLRNTLSSLFFSENPDESPDAYAQSDTDEPLVFGKLGENPQRPAKKRTKNEH